jgi:hypothetical protein
MPLVSRFYEPVLLLAYGVRNSHNSVEMYWGRKSMKITFRVLRIPFKTYIPSEILVGLEYLNS